MKYYTVGTLENDCDGSYTYTNRAFDAIQSDKGGPEAKKFASKEEAIREFDGQQTGWTNRTFGVFEWSPIGGLNKDGEYDDYDGGVVHTFPMLAAE